MKKFISIVIILAISVTLGVIIRDYPGMFVVQFGKWRIDGSLWLGVLVLISGYFILHYLFAIIGSVFKAPRRIVAFTETLSKNRSRRLMHQGLMELVEGQWQRAERNLLNSVSQCETPLLSYLGLAKSAQEQGNDKQRDRYLKLAYEQDGSASIAIGLTQAQLQYQHGQYEQSLATLKHLQTLSPHHPKMLNLLKQIFRQLNEWDQLLTILPRLKKNQVISGDEVIQLEREAFLFKLNKAEKAETASDIKETWKKLPKKYHTDVVMVYQYANALISHREPFEAEECIRQALKRDWHESLVRLYGQINHPDPDKLLAQAEGWLRNHGESANLLLSLGRLSCACQLWGKAERYFEASINIKPDVETYTELACLYEKLDKLELSHKFFRKGATMVSPPYVDRLPVPSVSISSENQDELD
jgi:HemY protein